MSEVDRIIANNLGLVYAQLNRFNLRNDPDAESAAMEALSNAVIDYDSSRNCKLSTVASVYIYNALCGYLRSTNRPNKLEVVSLSSIVLINDEEHELQEVVESTVTVEGTILKNERYKALMHCFSIAYNNLKSAKQRGIIDLWRKYGFDSSHTEIADKCNVSQSYVTQTIAVFKASIKKLMEENYDNS